MGMIYGTAKSSSISARLTMSMAVPLLRESSPPNNGLELKIVPGMKKNSNGVAYN
jgi:hypothetical protein